MASFIGVFTLCCTAVGFTSLTSVEGIVRSEACRKILHMVKRSSHVMLVNRHVRDVSVMHNARDVCGSVNEWGETQIGSSELLLRRGYNFSSILPSHIHARYNKPLVFNHYLACREFSMTCFRPLKGDGQNKVFFNISYR